jgi:predicted MFS family arabinose efflux permease
MLDPLNPLYNSLLTYIFIIILLILYKPNIIYNKKSKKFKQFGVNKDSSLLPLPILSLLTAIIVYVVFSYIEKFYSLKLEYYELLNKNK